MGSENKRSHKTGRSKGYSSENADSTCRKAALQNVVIYLHLQPGAIKKERQGTMPKIKYAIQ